MQWGAESVVFMHSSSRVSEAKNRGDVCAAFVGDDGSEYVTTR